MKCIQLITLACLGLAVVSVDTGVEGHDVLLRLRDGESRNEGRVEIYHGLEWYTLCNETWNENIAQVVCRQLGYSGVQRVGNTHDFGLSMCQIFPGYMCDGDEDSLAQCDEIEATGYEFCEIGAAVVCQTYQEELERHLIRAIAHKLAYESARSLLQEDLDEKRDEKAKFADFLEEKDLE
ncbi:egg peptide speract receptor-like [Asterias rubens]|uniref:egg peptide speract receptor-like n=1 Tax=Asterias rubens TaxID=7604 RepID=UPI00145543D8|nr:egg peptide speract receptor-like [Asterias rubens]